MVPVGNGLAGSDLRDLCAGARHELVLTAPFIKVRALEEVLEHARLDVSVTCITRWRPDEVASGVSDLEVFDTLTKRKGATLLLLPRLHAKYFRADERCLVGSANITARALGWISPPNIELLIEAPATHSRLAEFEHRAMSEGQLATAQLRSLMEAAAERIRHTSSAPSLVLASTEGAWHSESHAKAGPTEIIESSQWFPRLRQPSDLFLAYCGRTDELTASARESALHDLAALDPPRGLTPDAFGMVVGVALLQMPLVARIDAFVAEPRRFGAVRNLIAVETGLRGHEASAAWQATMRWLLYFLPSRYTRMVPSHSEVFARVPS